jgi:UDP-2,4-diacetamido-2,4,6-trideoxy-beta-L-altropyranose hydrolase
MTLAKSLCDKGATATFISRPHPGHLCGLIKDNGFSVSFLTDSHANKVAGGDSWLGTTWQEDAKQTKHAIKCAPGPADWLIVDHYSLDAKWEEQLRSSTRKIMVIDDLANRPHDCDLLLDQNYYCGLETRYNGLIPAKCRKLLGPSYVLLRDEFRKVKHLAKVRNGCVTRILVFLGGSDPENLTAKTLHALDQINRPDIAVDVVVGASNVHQTEIKTICQNRVNTNYYFQVNNLAELMLNADLSIGAGGATTWERCFLGLPTLTIVIADNQLQTTLDLSSAGLIWYLGLASNLNITDISRAVNDILLNPELVRDMSARTMAFMDNQKSGGIDAVTEFLIES